MPWGRKKSSQKQVNNEPFSADLPDDELFSAPLPDASPELQGEAQEVMKDNLDLMYDVVMRIREDPEFASNIYSNCPRLQNLLNQHPDLRPIFEDPKLVRINFEQVYRDNGGVLPGDPPKKERFVRLKKLNKRINKILSHPFFFWLKILIIVKKLMSCLSPTKGIGMIRGLFWPAPEDIDIGGDEGGNPANREAKMQLNSAADHMEEPETQEKMQAVMDDPEGLQDAIENDKELRALRDSNPLCAELMSDPNTMRILVDPDNLRALGEAPDLIELDFADPDWTPPESHGVGAGGLASISEVPELEGGGGGGADLPSGGGGADLPSGGGDTLELAPDEVDADAMVEEPEIVEESGRGGFSGGGIDDDALDDKTRSAKTTKAKGHAKGSHQQKQEGGGGEGTGLLGNFLTSGATVLGGALIGDLFDGIGEVAGAAGEVEGLEGGVEGGVEGAEGLEGAEEVPVEEEQADYVGAMQDEMEGNAEADTDGKKTAARSKSADGGGGKDKKKAAGIAGGIGSAFALGGLAAAIGGPAGDFFADTVETAAEGDSEEDEDDDGAKKRDGTEKKKGRLASLSKFSDVVKEHVITAIAGENAFEALEELQEEAERSEEEEDEEDEKNQEVGKKGHDEVQSEKDSKQGALSSTKT